MVSSGAGITAGRSGSLGKYSVTGNDRDREEHREFART